MDSTRDRARIRVDPWQEADPRQEADPWQGVDRWQDADPWQESLERSRARRGKSMQDSTRVARGRARRPTAKRLRARILTVKTVVPVLALAAAILASALTGGGPDASPTAATADAQRAATSPPQATPRPRPAGWRGCPLAVAPAGYVNPLASAIVKPERIDQGVDYAGVGKLAAIGAGRVTYLATGQHGLAGSVHRVPAPRRRRRRLLRLLRRGSDPRGRLARRRHDRRGPADRHDHP